MHAQRDLRNLLHYYLVVTNVQRHEGNPRNARLSKWVRVREAGVQRGGG